MAQRASNSVLWIPVAAFFCAISLASATPVAKADAVTYTYTGNQFATCNGSYSGACGHETVSFSLAAPLGDNLNVELITPFLTAFSASDGSGLTINRDTIPLNTPFLGTVFAFVSTDSSGNITAWSIESDTLCNDVSCSDQNFIFTGSGLENVVNGMVPPLDFATVNYPSGNSCININSSFAAAISFEAGACSFLDTAYTFDNPGTWTKTVNTPEPSSLLLLGIGLALVALQRSRKRARRTHQLA